MQKTVKEILETTLKDEDVLKVGKNITGRVLVIVEIEEKSDDGNATSSEVCLYSNVSATEKFGLLEIAKKIVDSSRTKSKASGVDLIDLYRWPML